MTNAVPCEAREPQHGVEHLVGGVRVEVAGRLVGQHAGRLGDQRAREGAALALAAGELARLVLEALAEADLAPGLSRPLLSASLRPMRRMNSGIATFSTRGELRQQVVELVDEAERRVAHPAALGLAHAR